MVVALPCARLYAMLGGPHSVAMPYTRFSNGPPLLRRRWCCDCCLLDIKANTHQTSLGENTGLSMLCCKDMPSFSMNPCILFHSLHEPHDPCNKVLEDLLRRSTERVVSSLEHSAILIYHSPTFLHRCCPSPEE